MVARATTAHLAAETPGGSKWKLTSDVKMPHEIRAKFEIGRAEPPKHTGVSRGKSKVLPKLSSSGAKVLGGYQLNASTQRSKRKFRRNFTFRETGYSRDAPPSFSTADERVLDDGSANTGCGYPELGSLSGVISWPVGCLQSRPCRTSCDRSHRHHRR